MLCLLCIEASHQRGMGHLYRAMNLATGLLEGCADAVFVMNADEPSEEILRQRGFLYEILPSYPGPSGWEEEIISRYRPSWWINDRMDTTAGHAERVLGAGIRLATFDDHGEGGNLADFNCLAMDLNPLHKKTNGLYGPDYIILSPRAGNLRSRAYLPGNPLHLLITLGGSDTYGVTPMVLTALAGLGLSLRISVVLGPNFRSHRELAQSIKGIEGSVAIHQAVDDLIGLIASADMLVCGGGVTLFEAAAVGTPALMIANEPHELPVTQWFAQEGFGISAGSWKDGVEERIREGLMMMTGDREGLNRMSQRGKELVDCRGRERIIELMRGRE
ncbi:MAG: hypothetical protein HGA78_03205 [Nitrospirales bacterium]|nr:hypothetical protein [Nitrospirales bacterium]